MPVLLGDASPDASNLAVRELGDACWVWPPIFPERFTSLGSARTFMSEFVDFYNHYHRHTGIGLHTPADVHYGHADTTQNRRIDTLTAGRAQHPTRFTTPTVIPKILALPDTAWINQPQDDDTTSAA